jgi:hypothetical protein
MPIINPNSLNGKLLRGATIYGSGSYAANTGPEKSVSFSEAANTPTDTQLNTNAPTKVAMQTNIGNSGNTLEDYNYNNTINDIFKKSSELDSEDQLQVSRTKSDLAKAYEQAARNYKRGREANTNTSANAGMLYSGAYLKKQADTAEDYTRTREDINTSGQRSFEDLQRQTTTRRYNLEQQRLENERRQAQVKADAELQRAMQEAQTKAMQDLRAIMIAQNAQVNADAARMRQELLNRAAQNEANTNNNINNNQNNVQTKSDDDLAREQAIIQQRIQAEALARALQDADTAARYAART